jgi:type II secretion system protein N
MSQVIVLIQSFFKLIFSNKLKLLVVLVSTAVFLFLLFPFDDLSDLVAVQVSKATKNQVYVQFDHMDLDLIPAGLRLKNLSVETNQFPPLRTSEVKISPALSSVIYQKPAGSLTATGFLKGDVEVSLSSAPKSENGNERSKISIEAAKLSLSELRDLLSLPLPLRGSLDVKSNATADLAFREQPDVEVDVKIEKFEVPPSNVNTPLGPLNLPELKISSLQLKGRLSAGRFQITQAVIGKGSDELSGTVKGGISLQIQNFGGKLIPSSGSYAFDIDLVVKKSLEERAKLFLSFIDAYKSSDSQGSRYRFKVSASGPESVPNFGNF